MEPSTKYMVKVEFGIDEPTHAVGSDVEATSSATTQPEKLVEAGAPSSKTEEPTTCVSSCYYFTLENPVRLVAIKISRSAWFDSSIMVLIVLNTAILAMQDYRGGSEAWEYKLLNKAESVFMVAFILEMIIKIIAIGFFMHPFSYLRDAWNWLDFIVVLSGVMSFGMKELVEESGESSVSFLRTFRVLRPLRSLAAFPGMRSLVRTLLLSFPKMGNVVILAFFLLTLFAILGLNIWGGFVSRRCRLTASPITFMPHARFAECVSRGGWCVTDSPQVHSLCTADPLCAAAYASGEAYTLAVQEYGRDVIFVQSVSNCAGWCAVSSASLQQVCIGDCFQAYASDELFLTWPVDENQLHMCGGRKTCVAGTTCGSCYVDDDVWGPDSDAVPARVKKTCDNWAEDLNAPEFNFGITHFDHFGGAFLTVFQSITLEGWVDVMYMLQDGHGSIFPAIYFLLVVFIGNFFLFNVALAIIWDSFSSVEQETKEALGLERDSREVGQEMRALEKGEPLFEKSKSDPDKEEGVGVVYSKYQLQRIAHFNVTTLSMDEYPAPHHAKQLFLDITNEIFFWTFVTEMFICLTAFGPWAYWTNYVSAFDGVIVIVSAIEMSAQGSSAMTALRAFRLLRVFKLAKKWMSFRLLLKSIVGTLLQMGNFMFLLFLMIIVFSLMGQSFFALSFRFNWETGKVLTECQGFDVQCPEKCPGPDYDCVPRAHFDTFLWSFVTVFQILTGENWNTVMYDGMRAVGWHSSIFFIFVYICLQCAVLNLLLAVLMGNFEEQSTAMRELEASKRAENNIKKLGLAVAVTTIFKQSIGYRANLAEIEDDPQKDNANDTASAVPSTTTVMVNPASPEQGDMQSVSFASTDALVPVDEVVSPMSPIAPSLPVSKEEHEKQNSKETEPCFSLYNLRKLVQKVRNGSMRAAIYPAFDQFILISICLSSILMAFQTPLDEPNTTTANVFYYVNITFSIIFTIEMVLKMIAFGIFFQVNPDRPAYMLVSWNLLDFVVVSVSWIDILGPSNLASLKTLRILRALRPLRLISRNKNLKLVVDTLFKAVPELANLFIVGCLFFLIFGLGAISYFKGGFYSCWDNALTEPLNYKDYENTNGANGTTVPPYRGPLCYETGPLAEYRFMDVNSATCNEDNADYRRGSGATPICLVHCEMDENKHEFCEYHHPWGYRVMRCTDCQTEFCPNSDKDLTQTCIESCRDPRAIGYQCYEDQGDECIEECVAACICPVCDGLLLDAASCVEQGKKWVNFNQNFDNIGAAMSSLFEIATTEMWVDCMYSGVDCRGPYHQPKTNHAEYAVIFFILFILVGCFFVLNLCVGVIIDTFNMMKKEAGGQSIFLTDAQQKWVTGQSDFASRTDYLIRVANLQLHKQNKFRRELSIAVQSSRFENGIMACIILNSVVMAIQVFPKPSDNYAMLLRVFNFIFAGIFNVEALAKLSVFKLVYFHDSWNRFDLICVVATDIGILVELLTDAKLGAVMSAIRLFRIARLFRLVRFMEGLNRLFSAFVLSIPKLCNVAAILFLLVFLYAVLGVNLFGKVRFSGNHDEHANFRNWPLAVMTLFRSMTGEGWNELMHSIGRNQWHFESLEEKLCEPSMDVEQYYDIYQANNQIEYPIQCGSGVAATIYFISFTMVVTFVILNLFIAVIFEGFDDSQESDGNRIILECIELWKKYDPLFSLHLPLNRACEFIHEVSQSIIGGRKEATKEDKTDDLTSQQTPGRIGRRDNMQEMELKQARVLQVKVNPVNQTVSFTSAILSCLRLNLIGEDSSIMAELEAVDEAPQTTKRSMAADLDQFAVLTLEETIAATKIVKRYKMRKAAREKIRLHEMHIKEKKLLDENKDPRAAG
eukprot:GEMP01000464.1.p1 GENE.GEMP01000464.1~~GEMP01000464.1.p1  ORF type:complete len:1850 (+),score=300.04 GEMP01000464.1:241-5790(+)